MDWFMDSNLPAIIGIVIGGLIAFPIVKRIQARKKAQVEEKKNKAKPE